MATQTQRPKPSETQGSTSSPTPRKPRARSSPVGRKRANTRLGYDVSAIIFIALGLILLATLAFPSPHGENLIGNFVITGLKWMVGIGAWFFPFLLITLGAMMAIGRSRSLDNAWAAVSLFITFISWWHLGHVFDRNLQFSSDNLMHYGGFIGACLSWLFRTLFSVFGAHVLFLAASAIGTLFLLDIPLPAVLGPVERSLKNAWTLFRSGDFWRDRDSDSDNNSNGDRNGENSDLNSKESAEREELRRSRTGKIIKTPRLTFKRQTPEPFSPPASLDAWPQDDDDDLEPETYESRLAPLATAPPLQPSLFAVRSNLLPVTTSMSEPEGEVIPSVTAETETEEEIIVAKPRKSENSANSAKPESRANRYIAPKLDLLRAPETNVDLKASESTARREVILQTLEDFGVGAAIENVTYGPTLTRYEVALAPGIKVSKIVSLADNIAMSLAAIDVRVEAPIPGKSAIGIEVPNDKPRVVTLREVIESPEFKNAPGKLTFALGKDVTGAVRFADLAKMPHLLIGGSTGSGKSVGLNTLICSLIYRCSPRELKFLMIDPKKVELSLYEGIPHLASPVITNVKQAPSLFKQAIREMEARYDKFAKAQTRNIEGYNAKVLGEERLPYWVIIVDELADLMMQSGPEIEQYICRLAQLARATGIHLVIATQRPSVNVITGTIKANISSRIGFAVNSAVDSRTILDQTGADRLIGRGDMLFMPMDAAKPIRIQGCFVSEQETEALVNFLKNQGQPQYEVLPPASRQARPARTIPARII